MKFELVKKEFYQTIKNTLRKFVEVQMIDQEGKKSPAIHYDSYVTEDFSVAAREVELDAEKELQEIRKPREWKEEFSDYMEAHPGQDVDEVIDGFGSYYDKLWDEYNKQSRQTIDREIKVKSR